MTIHFVERLLKSIHFKKIFRSFKSVVIFADFVLISVKMTTLMKEMRIAQLSAKISYTYFQACLPHWKYLLVENISFKYLFRHTL